MREADEREPRFVEPALGQRLGEVALEDRGGRADIFQHLLARPPLKAEPLPPEGRALAGKGRVGRDELRLGQERSPLLGEADKVGTVGAVAVQRHDQLPGCAAGAGRPARSVENIRHHRPGIDEAPRFVTGAPLLLGSFAMIVTRFAPSPTGLLHLGHAFSALTGWRAAHETGGRFLLRIEDIDAGRCREEFVAAIRDDLSWLGLDWDGAVRRQSEHFDDYRAVLEALRALGVLYPCFCSRAEIARAASAPQGDTGRVYPGTCRHLGEAERAARIAGGEGYALRLDVALASLLAGALDWHEDGKGRVAADPRSQGDVVLARKDFPASYHLAVAVDDASQGVTLVTRGEGSFRRDRDPSPAASVARLARTALPPSSADDRCEGQASCQTGRGAHPQKLTRSRAEPRGNLGDAVTPRRIANPDSAAARG